MGQCPSCGKKKLFLKTKNCLVCGKEGCIRCMPLLMEVFWGLNNIVRGNEKLFVCSAQCVKTYAERVEKMMSNTQMDLDEEEIPVSAFLDLTLRVGSHTHNYFISHMVLKALQEYPFEVDELGRYVAYSNIDKNLLARIERKGKIMRAKTLEKVRRFEDAAKVYERIGMYEEAGKVRAKDRQVTVRRTEVSVDLNSLLKQIRQGGVVVVYRCPHCNAPIKIGKGTKVEALRVCEHCGSEIEPIDVADILRTALS